MEGETSFRSMEKVPVPSPNGKTEITWNTIPPEVLEKVLTPLYSPLKPRDMARLREVCTRWRDVIDGNFPFQLTVDDTKMDVTQLSHLRLSPSVVVSSLVVELDPEVSIFKDATEIAELKIRGDITPRNFQQLLIDAVNLKQLSLSDIALSTNDLMQLQPNMEPKFQEAWERLTSLTLALNMPMEESLFEILSTEMPNLANLKITLKIPDLEIFFRQLEDFTDALFSFLNRSQSLSVLQFSAQNAYSSSEPNDLLPVYTGDKQLEIIRFLSILPEIWHSLLPLVKAQRSLKALQVGIDFSDHHVFIPNPTDTYLITALEAMLHLNQTTLTCIQLNNLNLSEDLNAGIFAEISNLRHLELQRNQKGSFRGRSLIVNLGMLPNSIEVLNLRGFTCDPADLLQMADRLEKIKHVDLVDIRKPGDSDPAVSLPVLEILARKRDISTVTIFPLSAIVVENSHEEVNGKHFLLINGYRIQVFFCRGGYYMNFNFKK